MSIRGSARAMSRLVAGLAAGLVGVWTLVAAPSALGQEAPEGALPPGPPVTAIASVVVSPLTGDQLPGIDVSHWQEAIDWTQVAASGQRFAFAKATEGRTYVDPRYAANKAGAATVGIAFGAYHFARPDDSANDAILEADHFVDVAQLVPGDLLPVLDIERTGGLSRAEVTTWILTWLGRVTERLGVRPMVYTSPNGWNQRTGDTTAVADAGYTVLWVAHWGVDSPTVPAQDWAGNGWTFWQYTDCGTVPGIAGCVDMDVYDGTDLGPVTIPSPDVTPPSVTIAPPVELTDPVALSFSEIVHGVTPDDVALWTPEEPVYEPIGLTCRSGQGLDVDCVTGNVRIALVQPLQTLVPGQGYHVAVNPPGAPLAIVDRSGNPAPTTELDFTAATELEQTSEALTYDWRTVSSRRAYGRSYAVEHLTGASTSFTFAGGGVTWYTIAGPAQGKASVWIDGRSMGVFDQYAARPAFKVPRRFAGLEPGTHTITVRALGRGSHDATGTSVAVDAFAVGKDVVANPELRSRWASVREPLASGGSVVHSDLARASLELTFRGTGIQWYTVRDIDQGRAEVYLDGALVRTVDGYAAEPAFGVARTIDGLAAGMHTLRIVVLGQARPRAEGTLVTVDRFIVLP